VDVQHIKKTGAEVTSLHTDISSKTGERVFVLCLNKNEKIVMKGLLPGTFQLSSRIITQTNHRASRPYRCSPPEHRGVVEEGEQLVEVSNLWQAVLF
jgi:hypothetical protein